MEVQTLIEPAQAARPEISDEERAIRMEYNEVNAELQKIQSEYADTKRNLARTEQVLVSPGGKSPGLVVSTARKLRKSASQLQAQLEIIEAPKRALQRRGQALSAQLFEYERAKAIKAHNAKMLILYRLCLELNEKIEPVNALIEQITELSRVKLDSRYRVNIPAGRIFKAACQGSHFIPNEIKPIKIFNEEMLKEAVSNE